MDAPSERDFFISYRLPDQRWAEWLAWQLEDHGYSTIVQVWDFVAGSNFVIEMDRATQLARRTVLVLSPDFLAGGFAHAEWAAAFKKDPEGVSRKLVPVRVRECSPDGLLGQIVYIDLVDADEEAARALLFTGLRKRAKPPRPPAFPGAAAQPEIDPPSFPDNPEASDPSLIVPPSNTSSQFSNELREALVGIGSSSSAQQQSSAALLELMARDEYSTSAEHLVRAIAANLFVEHARGVNRVLVRALERSLRLAETDRLSHPLDLARRDLRRANFTGLDLRQTDLAFALLRAADLSGAELFRARGYQVDIERARFSDANLEEVRFHKAVGPGAVFHRARLVSAHFRGSVMPGAEFYKAQMQGAHFEGANLRGARFDQAELADAYFSGAELDDAALTTILRASAWRDAHFADDAKARLEELDR